MTELAFAAATSGGSGIGFLYNLYAFVSALIVVVGLAVNPLARQLTPPRDREELSFGIQRALNLGLIT